MKTFNTLLSFLSSLLLLTAFPVLANGGNDQTNNNQTRPDVENHDILTDEWNAEFRDRLNDDISNGFDSAGSRVSNSIFESISDLSLLDVGISDMGDAEVEVQRKVYDNHDITESWTVMDRFSLPIRLPLLVTGSASIGSGPAALNLGLNLRFESYNIRQTYPKNYQQLPGLADVQEQVDQAKTESKKWDLSRLEELFDLGDGDEWYSNILWNSDNPRTRARYSNLLNLFSSPLRLPLTPKRLKKMDVGEITSYSVDGSVQLSGSVGWSAISIPGIVDSSDYSIGLALTTYLNGRFRISVYKESERYMRVKLSKRTAKGLAGSIGSLSSEYDVFKGIVILGKRVLDFKERIIPFNFHVGKETSKSFDVGYRFDLENPEAKKAYFKAVFGRFKQAEDLTQAANGVKRIYDRTQTGNSRYTSKRIELGFLFEQNHRTNNTYTDAIITIDGKQKHFFRSINENYRSWDTIWGSTETQHYRFNLVLDANEYATATPHGLVMHVEGRLKDRHTNGKEIRRYMTEVETATGKYDFFPKLPLFGPFHYCNPLENPSNKDMNEDEKWAASLMDHKEFDSVNEMHPNARPEGCQKKFKLAPYGKTEFFYRVGFTRNQIDNFINYPAEKMWDSLELAFGVKEGEWSKPRGRAWYHIRNLYASILNIPLYLIDINLKQGSNLLRAREFYENWQKLKELQKDPKELIKSINQLFATTTFSFEFLNIIKTTLEKDATIEYTINARAKKLFGQISKHGNTLGIIDTFAINANQRIDFDRAGSRINVDHQAYVDAFHLDKINNNTVKLRFRLPKNPNYVFIKADKSSNWRLYKNLARFVMANNGNFQEGFNEFTLTRKMAQEAANFEDEKDFRKILSKAIFSGDYTTISMAISLDKESWGSVVSKRIRIKDKDSKPGLLDFDIESLSLTE